MKELLNYNPETGVFTWIGGRVGVRAGATAGRIHTEGYRRIMINYRFYHASRLAWLYIYGEWPSRCIDHINGERGDDRIANLREVTRRENQQNMVYHRNGHLPGTSFHRQVRGKNNWVARIYVGGKSRFLGTFPTAEEAHATYVKACNDLQACL